MKKSVYVAIPIIFLIYVYSGLYKIPKIDINENITYNYTFINPFKNDESKLIMLLNYMKKFDVESTELNKNILFKKVEIKDDMVKIYMSGDNQAASSYNELKIIKQISELVRINFDYIKKMIIMDDANIFKHVDIRFAFKIND